MHPTPCTRPVFPVTERTEASSRKPAQAPTLRQLYARWSEAERKGPMQLNRTAPLHSSANFLAENKKGELINIYFIFIVELNNAISFFSLMIESNNSNFYMIIFKRCRSGRNKLYKRLIVKILY